MVLNSESFYDSTDHHAMPSGTRSDRAISRIWHSWAHALFSRGQPHFFRQSKDFYQTFEYYKSTTTLRKRGGLMMILVRKTFTKFCEWSWWYKQIQWNARCCYAQDLYDKEEVFSGDEGKICKNCTFHPSLLDCFMILWCLGAHKVMSRLRFFFNKTFVMFSFRHLYSPAPVLLNCLM